MMERYPNYDRAIELHEQLARRFKASDDPIEPAGVRSEHLLDSALQRPFTGYQGQQKYKTLTARAAALLHSLIHNHPFHNGNKRTGLILLLDFLHHHRKWLRVTDDELFGFVIRVADHSLLEVVLSESNNVADREVEAMTSWLAPRVQTLRRQFPQTSTNQFLDLVVAYGGDCRSTGGKVIVRGPDARQSVSFSGARRFLDGNVVRVYLQKIGLGQNVVPSDLFDPPDPESALIREFWSVLRGLAVFDRQHDE